jgi:hypothetical protein
VAEAYENARRYDWSYSVARLDNVLEQVARNVTVPRASAVIEHRAVYWGCPGLTSNLFYSYDSTISLLRASGPLRLFVVQPAPRYAETI